MYPCDTLHDEILFIIVTQCHCDGYTFKVRTKLC